MIYFITNKQPLSIQSPNTSKYKRRLKTEFEQISNNYHDIPLSIQLYSKVLYIHYGNSSADIDNLSKPFVDAFKGVIYTDDNIINHRIASIICLSDFELCEFRVDLLPMFISERLDEFLSNNSNHISIFEVGEFKNTMFKVGE